MLIPLDIIYVRNLTARITFTVTGRKNVSFICHGCTLRGDVLKWAVRPRVRAFWLPALRGSRRHYVLRMLFIYLFIYVRYLVHHFEANLQDAPTLISETVTFRVSRRRREMYSGPRPSVSVCLSLAAFSHYCTDPDVTWGNGMGCKLDVRICNRCMGFVAMTT